MAEDAVGLRTPPATGVSPFRAVVAVVKALVMPVSVESTVSSPVPVIPPRSPTVHHN